MVWRLFHDSWYFDNQEPTFSLIDTKLYVPVDNAKLLQQLKSSFIRTINWNKYRSKVTIQERNRCLDYLINPSLGVRLAVLSFENDTDRTSYKRYYLLKDYNVMIDGQNFFNPPLKNNLRTNDIIQKITNGQGDDYATGCLLDYLYFKE